MASAATQPAKDQNKSLAIEPIALRVPEACRYLGIGRSTLYVLISKSEIEIIELGEGHIETEIEAGRLAEVKGDEQV